MAIEIPTRTDAPHYAFRMDLDGTIYRLDFDWNDRDSAWYLGVATVDGTPLVTGRKIIINLPLLSRFKDPRLPPGVLVALDSASAAQDPDVDELGTRVRLLYIPVAEVTEVQGG
jgi:hypothetical protein